MFCKWKTIVGRCPLTVVVISSLLYLYVGQRVQCLHWQLTDRAASCCSHRSDCWTTVLLTNNPADATCWCPLMFHHYLSIQMILSHKRALSLELSRFVSFMRKMSIVFAICSTSNRTVSSISYSFLSCIQCFHTLSFLL